MHGPSHGIGSRSDPPGGAGLTATATVVRRG